MIEIQYSCQKCGLRRAKCYADERVAGEDVVQWMKRSVEPELARNHGKRSPYCVASSLSEVRIPIAPGANIGESQPRH